MGFTGSRCEVHDLFDYFDSGKHQMICNNVHASLIQHVPAADWPASVAGQKRGVEVRTEFHMEGRRGRTV